MSNQLVIWMGATLVDPVRWIERNNGDEVVNAGDLSDAAQLHELAALSAQCSTWLMVSGESYLYRHLELPNRSKAAKQAIPFMLEDALCQPVELLHIASGAFSAKNALPVIAVEHALFSETLEYVKEQGISPELVIPDYLMLPVVGEGALTLACDGDRVLCRSEDFSGVLDAESLSTWWPLLQGYQSIELIGDLHLSAHISNEAEVTVQHLGRPLLEHLSCMGEARPEVNLLQNSFGLSHPIKKWVYPFRIPLVMCFVLLSVSLFEVWFDNYRLGKQIESYDAAMVEVFQEVFPDAKRISNPYRQMKGKVKILEQDSSKQSFLRILAMTSEELQKQPEIKVEKIRYQHNDGSTQFQVKAPDYKSLEALNSHLEKRELRLKPGAYQKLSDSEINAQFTLWEKDDA